MFQQEVTFTPEPGMGHSYLTFKLKGPLGQIWYTVTMWHGETSLESGTIAYAEADGEYGDHLHGYGAKAHEVLIGQGAEGLWPYLETVYRENEYLWADDPAENPR